MLQVIWYHATTSELRDSEKADTPEEETDKSHIYQYHNLYIFWFTNLYLHLSIHPSIYPSIYPSIHLSIHPSIYLSIYPPYHPPIYPSLPRLAPQAPQAFHSFNPLSFPLSFFLLFTLAIQSQKRSPSTFLFESKNTTIPYHSMPFLSIQTGKVSKHLPRRRLSFNWYKRIRSPETGSLDTSPRLASPHLTEQWVRSDIGKSNS